MKPKKRDKRRLLGIVLGAGLAVAVGLSLLQYQNHQREQRAKQAARATERLHHAADSAAHRAFMNGTF